MKNLLLTFLFLLGFWGCSGTDDSDPVSTEINATGFIRGYVNSTSWYSSKITTSKNNNIRIVKATQEFSNHPIFSSSVLEFRIGVSLAGVYGIGEDEPGYKYYIKAYYTLVSKSGTEDEYYKAYYNDTSLLTINRINDSGLDANFNFTARTDDSTKTVVFTTGSIQINY